MGAGDLNITIRSPSSKTRNYMNRKTILADFRPVNTLIQCLKFSCSPRPGYSPRTSVSVFNVRRPSGCFRLSRGREVYGERATHRVISKLLQFKVRACNLLMIELNLTSSDVLQNIHLASICMIQQRNIN
ncbi:NADH-dependent flavin oxidoreductase nadA [Fusarium oxysporum f. sp. albedinis]|nr:NADH-dependent flavin oxidoreductase nadA [Fusarium oxysporum f. sp. albedinis]